MLDPQLLRKDLVATADKLARRGYKLDVDAFNALEEERRVLQVATQDLQNLRNTRSKEIGKVKQQGGDIQPLLEQVGQLGDELKEKESQLSVLQERINSMMLDMPNIPDEIVPDGKDEADNKEIRKWGEIPAFDFDALDHVDLGARNQWLDSERAAKLAGSRFTLLQGPLARLHRALGQFMLDMHTSQHDYTEIMPPFLVNPDCMTGTGQLPKFEDDAFATSDEIPKYLIPTAEVPLSNLVRDEILEDEQMPLNLTAHTPCFRREAGSYGRDVRGMIRQHQFEKVELVRVVRPDDSEQALEELTSHAENILQALKLPYRVMLLCSGDMGFSAARTYDLEVWLPGQQQYREISSCSNTRDFQARRMKARWRNPESGKPELVHTLNGSGLAIGRTLIAVMENYQQADGHIKVPDVLQSYMGGVEIL